MQEFGLKSASSGLASVGLNTVAEAHWNLPVAALVEEAIVNKEGVLTDTGALMSDTGRFTGRSPKDRFIVEDEKTKDTVWWGDINLPISTAHFDAIHAKMVEFLSDKKVYVRDAYAGADEQYRLNLRVVNTQAWQNMFCYNMFLRPTQEELANFAPNFTIICAPEFEIDDPAAYGTRQANFAIINFTKRMILIGGTGYAGEMKKGIFSVMNFLLPHDYNTLSMHCSANIGSEGDTAVFFGLSGTGKTTLSADPNRGLIGDDEHGWTENGVFNYEGGCYAKTINLSRETEPEIYDAIKFGAIVENTRFQPGSRSVNYEDVSVTQNTRTAYPIHHIANAVSPSKGGIPQNIFFLTYDAFGVLPPISKLSKSQAMYQFISGYTSKVAGTEEGVTEPQTVFSACFGAPFLPLHPSKYAELLGKKMDQHDVNVWLINTGLNGGPYGKGGSRMKLKFTRAMITAALTGALNDVAFTEHPIFGFMVPAECPGVPTEALDPEKAWKANESYAEIAGHLANEFVKNFQQFEDGAHPEILEGAPNAGATANA